METRMYKLNKVAEIFGVTRYTILNWINEGKLECLKLSPRCWRVTEEQLQDFYQKTYKSSGSYFDKMNCHND